VPWLRHRRQLALAAALDALGVMVLAVAIDESRNGLIATQLGLLLALIGIYWSLGWLFGSYTLLKERRLHRIQLGVRVVITSLATISAGALLGWLMRAGPEVSLLHRGSLLPLFGLAALWSAAVRLMLVRLRTHQPAPGWEVVALPAEIESIRQEWTRMGAAELPRIQSFHDWPFQPDGSRRQAPCGMGVALTPGVLAQPDVLGCCEVLAARGLPILSLAQLAERELQRIPPGWVGDQWLLFSDRIEGERAGFQKQLKRFADVLVSLLLLLLTAPLLGLAALLIRLGDGGPVFYVQCRTGLLADPIRVIKLRTMVPDAETDQAVWADQGDHRITPIGRWLRRTRLDELPQLLNVLKGEMSLIGPRPERPELEEALEREIPNYRLRHWIRPGLSGWAQVNMPYTSTVEDAELKLSFDLFYLRNSSIWLDLLILLKTVKIVLKAAGR
jgi:lipopolysaccharide/colanic/teichoic acid biosynthesis glycosyltransferase